MTFLWGSYERQCQRTSWSPSRQYSLLSPQLLYWTLNRRGLLNWSSMTSPWWIHTDYSWWFSSPSLAWKWFPGWAAPRDRGKADQPIVPRILLPILLEDRSDLCFPPVFEHFSQLPWLIKDYWEWLWNDIYQLPQHSWVHSIRAHGFLYVQLA